MNVKFHLPDFTTHFTLNLVFLSMLKSCPQYFREGVEIASVYGAFPPSLWNGGRVIGGKCDESFVRQAVEAFNSQGIPLRFTFTNPALKEEHLSDPFCNMVMKAADNGMNGVIVNSPLLEDYIRKEYPNYKITSSTCKRITDPEKTAQELEKDYDIVVLDYDLNNKFDVLGKLPNKEKLEILVNSCCDPACKRRSAHYDLIGRFMICYNEHLKNHPNVPFVPIDYPVGREAEKMECDSMYRNAFEIRRLSTHVTPDDIWNKYVPMGFSQFKIEGRTMGNMFMIENYMYYMVKPEFRDEARVMFMHNLERSNVIHIG